jgi:hypothetical protein
MADTLPTSNSYQMLGGINDKASRYQMSTAQFLDLRNLDFDVPNALQKRPGSTQAVSPGTSGPIQSLFEFIKLTGESYVVAASDTALFYLASNQYTLLSAGWNNGQPPDMLTFANKLWIANGQNWSRWDGSSFIPIGLPQPTTSLFAGNRADDFRGYTITLVGGSAANNYATSYSPKSLYIGYSYVRSDGYYGPESFVQNARNAIITDNKTTSGAEYFAGNSQFIGGFTIPSGYGISAIALWVAVDTIDASSPAELIPGVGNVQTGHLGWLASVPFGGLSQSLGSAFQGATVGSYSNFRYMSATLRPDADTSRFWLYTIIPGASLYLKSGVGTGVNNSFINGGGATFWAIDFSFRANGVGESLPTYAQFDGAPPLTSAFSGMPFNFFATYTPKYIEVSQNVMFSAGFSAQPSTVWFSELGEPEVYQPDSFFEVRTNDGDKIYGLKAFNNSLIVAKEHSFSKLIGSSADNYQLVELSSDFGCISSRTMLTKDQTLYWLDKKGILEFNGANWTIVSSGVENIFRRMNVDAAKENACGVHNIFRNQLWWGIPVDGSTVNNVTVVYDYLVGAWTYFDGFNPGSFALIKGAQSRPTVWRGDYSGLVHYTGSSFYSDSGRGITCMAFTKFENVGGENQTTLWRRLFLDVAPDHSGVTGAINCQIFSDYNTTAVQHTAMATQDQFQTRVEMGVIGKAVAAQFSHNSASLPLLINGYGFASRPLRNT